jgi:energy-coupling factor transporter ATP-binding protein EcfA2
VDDVSFTAPDGEITGLLGPNGAGKTTTMRMLYTLMQPDAGRVLVDGIDALADPVAVRRALGVLPDARGVYKRLTARENIAYFGACTAWTRPPSPAHRPLCKTRWTWTTSGPRRRRASQPGPAHQDRDRPCAGARPAQRASSTSRPTAWT